MPLKIIPPDMIVECTCHVHNVVRNISSDTVSTMFESGPVAHASDQFNFWGADFQTGEIRLRRFYRGSCVDGNGYETACDDVVASIARTILDDDGLKIVCSGDVLEVWHLSGVSSTLVFSTTNSFNNTAHGAGMLVTSAIGSAVDNFSVTASGIHIIDSFTRQDAMNNTSVNLGTTETPPTKWTAYGVGVEGEHIGIQSNRAIRFRTAETENTIIHDTFGAKVALLTSVGTGFVSSGMF